MALLIRQLGLYGHVMAKWPLTCIRARVIPHSLRATSFSCSFLEPPTMDADSQRQKRQDNILSLLNAAIEAMNLAKEISSATPAKAVFVSVGVLLTMIRVHFLPLLRYSILGSNVTRTRRPTDPITSSWG